MGPRAGAPSYYAASTQEELAGALQTIVDTAQAKSEQTCLFALPPNPTDDGRTTYDAIRVFADGAPLGRDSTRIDGWDYADSSHRTIVVYGPTCDAVLNGAATLSASFRCLGV